MTDSLRAADLPLGRVTQLDDYAVGNNGDYFAVSRRCRRLGANLAAGRDLLRFAAASDNLVTTGIPGSRSRSPSPRGQVTTQVPASHNAGSV